MVMDVVWALFDPFTAERQFAFMHLVATGASGDEDAH